MAAILLAMLFSLLMQGSMCSVGDTEEGCLVWRQEGNNVCCDKCQPGNHMVQKCGPDPKKLCAPCEPDSYAADPQAYKCLWCTQCLGDKVLVKPCTATTDTQCGCREGLLCGNKNCDYCVKKCGKGEEPTKDRSCRPCGNGTFNDQIHKECKPWSTKCPDPDQKIVALGNEVNDIKCANVDTKPVIRPDSPSEDKEEEWSLTWLAPTIGLFMALGIFAIIIIVLGSVKIKKRKTMKATITKTPIIRTPTDDPATLIAIECSFHEAQQEQGSSTESLASEDSAKQLIG